MPKRAVYQKLIEYQKLLEEKTAEELAHYVKLLTNVERQIDRIKGVKINYEKQLYEKQIRGEKSPVVIAYVNYLEKLDNDLIQGKKEIDRIKSKIDEIKNKLVQIRQKKKKLEKLDEKEKANYLKELEQEELKKLNEFSVHAFNSRNGKTKNEF